MSQQLHRIARIVEAVVLFPVFLFLFALYTGIKKVYVTYFKSSSTEANKDGNTIDAEIENFDNYGAEWWNKKGITKPLHDLNPLRLKYIDDRVEGGLKEKKVLDIGCGGGILSESMARKGANVLGIDMTAQSIKVATSHAKSEGMQKTLQYLTIAVEKLAESKEHIGQYDVVTCMEVIEHVPDPTVLMRATQKLLKPGGVCFYSTLDRSFKSFVFAIIGAEYILQMVPMGTHDWLRFVRPREMRRALTSCGLYVTDTTGMSFNPLTNKFWLSPDTSVNYFCTASNPRQ